MAGFTRSDAHDLIRMLRPVHPVDMLGPLGGLLLRAPRSPRCVSACLIDAVMSGVSRAQFDSALDRAEQGGLVTGGLQLHGADRYFYLDRAGELTQ